MSETVKQETNFKDKIICEKIGNPCYTYKFTKNNEELFSLKSVFVDNENKIHYNNEENGKTMFILVTKEDVYDNKYFIEYANAVRNRICDGGYLRKAIDYEFAVNIMASKSFDGMDDELDLGLDDELIYAYLFTHISPEQHKQIRLFDWVNEESEKRGFLKSCLSKDNIVKKLNLNGEAGIILPMVITDNNPGLQFNHISFVLFLKSFHPTNNPVILSFDTLSSGENIKSAGGCNEYYINYYKINRIINEPKQDRSGCGYLTLLNIITYFDTAENDPLKKVEEMRKNSLLKLNNEEKKNFLLKKFKLEELKTDITSEEITYRQNQGNNAIVDKKTMKSGKQSDQKKLCKNLSKAGRIIGNEFLKTQKIKY